MNKHKLLSALLVLTMISSLLTACGSNSSTETSATAATETAQTTDASLSSGQSETDTASVSEDAAPASAGGLETVSLPLSEGGDSISFWIPYPFFVGNMIEDMGQDVRVLAELQSRTGIDFDITAINGETEADQFALMIVSGDYCDVISDMANYSLGYDSAIEEEIIIDLYDLVQEYAPNYWYYITQDIDTLATLVTDAGHLPTTATLFKTSGAENQGWAIRQDWLDELGMSTPTTYDELADFVEACNTTYGSQGIYFAADGQDTLFGFGFDCGTEFLVLDGQVTHAYLRDAYYDYLSTAADWYSRGLIYQDFYLYGTDDTMDQLFCSGGLVLNASRCTAYEMFDSYTDDDYDAVYAPLALVKQDVDDELHYSTTVGSMIKREDT